MKKYTVSVIFVPEHMQCVDTLKKGLTLDEVISFLATKKCYLQKIVLLEFLRTGGGSAILKYTASYAAIITEEYQEPGQDKSTD